MKLDNADRPLLILNDFTINETTRFQAYGFLLHEEYNAYMLSVDERCGIEFYNDWIRNHYGLFSKSLEKDLNECIKVGIIEKIEMTFYDNLTANKINTCKYNLTTDGMEKWRNMLKNIPEVEPIRQRIESLQKISYYVLLGEIYSKYPEFTARYIQSKL